MTAVPGETWRTPIVSIDRGGYNNVSSLIYHGFLAQQDNTNQSIYAYGVVGGAATPAANTGTLLVVANETTPFGKDSITAVSIDIQIAVSGVVA
jgi:hypothetical protein